MSALVLQFCRFDSLVGRLVDFGTHGTVGHVDIVLPDGSLLGAQHEPGLGRRPSGVQVRPANYGDTCGMAGRVWVSLETTDECALSSMVWARAQIGAEYDTRAIEGIALDEDWSTPGKLICSGLAAGFLTQPSVPFIGYPLAKNWRIITPEELLLICSAFGPVVAL